MQDLTNKVAYITGGSKGIGLGIVEKLLDTGMRVAFTSRSQESADAAASTISTGYDKLLPLVSDVRDLQTEQAAVQETLSRWGAIDVVVANAGVGHFASIEDMTPEQWNEVIDCNLTGVFHTVKASVDALKKSEGYLITIASLAGTNFFAGGAAYNASKFGLVGFTQAVMLDLRHYGIKCTTIMPGSVATHFNGRTPSVEDAWKIQPEDLGEMVVDLLKMHPRTLPSKIEVRPSQPPRK